MTVVAGAAGISLHEYYRESVMPALPAGIVVLLAGVFFSMVGAGSWPTFLTSAAVTFLLGLLVVWRWGMRPAERLQLARRLRL